ncbi:MAG TPA: MFS transporter [Candidatus Limnocylindrales bacterium]|nr:MFS transporter [Candidatus Limnocylindrales bacterium]
MRGALIDVSPLRLDRDYRLLFSGQVVSGIGSQVTRLALPYQVYVLTGSTLAVGVLTLVQLVPILLFALGAGALADAVDRRRLLIVTQVGLALSSLALAGLALTPAAPLWGIFALAFVHAGLSSVDHPARTASVPRLVPPERLPAAIALGQLNFQVSSVAGPALGGVLIALVGVAGAYLVDVASFAAAIVALLAMRPLPPLADAVRPGLEAVREGLRFALGHRLLLSTFVIDLDAMIFGMPMSLFPALALDVFRVGPAGLGLLAAAFGGGALLGALLSGWVGRVRRRGLAVIRSVAVWGLGIVGFGVAALVAPVAGLLAFLAALACLALAGAADVLSAVFRSTILQQETPDALRGRVSALHILVVTGGPRAGDLEAAAAASVIGPALSALSGGLLCLLGLVGVVRAFPELAAHESPPTWDPPAT